MRSHKNVRRCLTVTAILSMLGLLVVFTPVSAQEGAEAEAAPAPEAGPAPAEQGQTETETEPAEPKKIPLSLKSANIDQIMKFLSDNTGKVVVRSKEVQAQITIISPKPVTPERAVELICHALRLEGVAVVLRDDVINLVPAKKVLEMGVETLVPEAEIPGAGVVRRIIEIKFADVAEMEKLITPLLSEGSKLVADPRSRRIVLTVPADELANLEKLIAQLDVLEIKETQVRIFKLKHAVAEEIAPILEAILKNASGAPPGGGKPPPSPKPSAPSSSSKP